MTSSILNYRFWIILLWKLINHEWHLPVNIHSWGNPGPFPGGWFVGGGASRDSFKPQHLAKWLCVHNWDATSTSGLTHWCKVKKRTLNWKIWRWNHLKFNSLTMDGILVTSWDNNIIKQICIFWKSTTFNRYLYLITPSKSLTPTATTRIYACSCASADHSLGKGLWREGEPGTLLSFGPVFGLLLL